MNHIYDEDTDKTLCGEYEGQTAYAISGGNVSCNDCLDRQTETCRNCGQMVLMMCRQMTGYCSELCKELHEEDLKESGL